MTEQNSIDEVRRIVSRQPDGVLRFNSASGRCPSCQVVAQHEWYGGQTRTFAENHGPILDEDGNPISDRIGLSRCVACRQFAVWVSSGPKVRSAIGSGRPKLPSFICAYPQVGVRMPPQSGLRADEIAFYEEAASIEQASPRAASALLRALLEQYLKRHLADAGHTTDSKRLVDLIELAVQHLDLSPTLKTGLESIRKRGNTAMHDPYGLTDDTLAEDLPWLFRAVDELVDELHVKPQKWAGMAEA